MSQSEKLTRPGDRIVDLIVIGSFYAFMVWVCRSHVPSTDPKMITLWGFYSAIPFAGVGWVALGMGRTVFRYQQELKKRKS